MYKVKRFSKKKNNESKTSKVLVATGAGLTASGLATAGVLNKKSSNLSKEVSKEFTPVDNTQKRVDRMMKDTKDLLDARLTHNNEALLDPRLKSYDEFGKVMEGRF